MTNASSREKKEERRPSASSRAKDLSAWQVFLCLDQLAFQVSNSSDAKKIARWGQFSPFDRLVRGAFLIGIDPALYSKENPPDPQYETRRQPEHL